MKPLSNLLLLSTPMLHATPYQYYSRYLFSLSTRFLLFFFLPQHFTPYFSTGLWKKSFACSCGFAARPWGCALGAGSAAFSRNQQGGGLDEPTRQPRRGRPAPSCSSPGNQDTPISLFSSHEKTFHSVPIKGLDTSMEH